MKIFITYSIIDNKKRAGRYALDIFTFRLN